METLIPEPAIPWLVDRQAYYRKNGGDSDRALSETFKQLSYLCNSGSMLTSRQRSLVESGLKTFILRDEFSMFVLQLATYINSCR